MANFLHPVTPKKAMQIGDVVQLRSGGPTMTIRSIESTGEAKCAWFWNGRVRHHTFSIHLLIPVDEKEDGGLIQ